MGGRGSNSSGSEKGHVVVLLITVISLRVSCKVGISRLAEELLLPYQEVLYYINLVS
jgi:hypothetical protein